MEHGCMERLIRKRGPQVWQFRWSEIDPGGKRLYHKKIVGTVEHYPNETAVRRAVVGLLSESIPMSDQQTLAQLRLLSSVIISSSANSQRKTPGAVTPRRRSTKPT
jgi:hypothetical protein